MWKNTHLSQWIRYEPLGEHLVNWTSAVFSHITRKINSVCIFSHDQETHDISAIHCTLNCTSNTICSPNVVLMLVHRLRRRTNIKPTLGDRSPNVVLMLVHRLRRRTNIKPTLGDRIEFASIKLEYDMCWYRYRSHSENHCTECENIREFTQTWATRDSMADLRTLYTSIHSQRRSNALWKSTPETNTTVNGWINYKYIKVSTNMSVKFSPFSRLRWNPSRSTTGEQRISVLC